MASPSADVYSALDLLDGDPAAKIDDPQEIRPSERDGAGRKTVFEALGNATRIRILEVLREAACRGYELQVVLVGLLQAGAPLGLASPFLLASPIGDEIAVVVQVGGSASKWRSGRRHDGETRTTPHARREGIVTGK